MKKVIINSDFLTFSSNKDCTVQTCTTMRTATDHKQKLQMETWDGQLPIQNLSKGEKAVAKSLKEKPTYGRNDIIK